MVTKTKQEGKTPDCDGDRYWGEIVRYMCPALYGEPVYYTDGTKIPYTITIPKLKRATESSPEAPG